MTRLLRSTFLASVITYASFACWICASACVLPEPPDANVWAPCESQATACPLDDGSFGRCLTSPGLSVCAPWGVCPASVGEGGENGKPVDGVDECLWSCEADADCPAGMVCGGVCMYEVAP